MQMFAKVYRLLTDLFPVIHGVPCNELNQRLTVIEPKLE